MTEKNRNRMLSKAYGNLLRQAVIMFEDYEHLAPDADSKIDPLRKRWIAKMRKTIQAVESIKVKASHDPRYDPSDILTAVEDMRTFC